MLLLEFNIIFNLSDEIVKPIEHINIKNIQIFHFRIILLKLINIFQQ